MSWMLHRAFQLPLVVVANYGKYATLDYVMIMKEKAEGQGTPGVCVYAYVCNLWCTT